MRALAIAAVLCAATAAASEGDRHDWQFQIDAGYAAADTALGSWTKAGLGKLRYGEDADGSVAARLFAEYRGRIAPTLTTDVVVDYVDDASSGLDLTEAYLDWRPIPHSNLQQQVRFGAFYPPFSLENASRGWQSPFSYSYSAINTWLGEEIRPVGAEWSMRRHIGFSGSPQELRAFAAGFYGNDPAGTLLFWRGFALHDRQTRLHDRLPMPPAPVWDSTGTIIAMRAQSLEPFSEIDHEPSAYAGFEWRYGHRALVQVARYDNRADPWAFRDGQWAWDTAFDHLAVQVSLPGRIGLMAQRLDGSTRWVQGALPSGALAPSAGLVEDAFSSKFLLLTRVIAAAQRISVRYDTFEMHRKRANPAFRSDDGDAWTVGYRYRHDARLSIGAEWLRVTSRRDPWSAFYGIAPAATERALRLELSYGIGPLAAR